jgi:hypothetical protein
MTSARTTLLSLCLLAGACRRAPPTQETPAASGPPSASALPPQATSQRAAASASAPAASASSRPAPISSAQAPLSPEEQASARRYLDALGRGRSLTTKKRFPEAIAAFDEALRVRPGDARALAERGYARLQATDLDGAERDFYATLARTPDQAVLSATTFNLATVAERRGNREQAAELREAARSHRVPKPPSDRCQAEIKRGKDIELGFATVKKLQTLRQVRTALQDYAQNNSETIDPPLPTTNEEASLLKDMLGGGPGPWRLITGTDQSSSHSTHLLFGQPADYTLIEGAMSMRYSRCGGTERQRIDMAGNPVYSSLFKDYTLKVVCPKEQDTEPGGFNQCSSGCVDPITFRQDFIVYDRATGTPLLGITSLLDSSATEGPVDPISVVVRENGVQLLGNGCNAFEPFKP